MLHPIQIDAGFEKAHDVSIRDDAGSNSATTMHSGTLLDVLDIFVLLTSVQTQIGRVRLVCHSLSQ